MLKIEFGYPLKQHNSQTMLTTSANMLLFGYPLKQHNSQTPVEGYADETRFGYPLKQHNSQTATNQSGEVVGLVTL